MLKKKRKSVRYLSAVQYFSIKFTEIFKGRNSFIFVLQRLGIKRNLQAEYATMKKIHNLFQVKNVDILTTISIRYTMIFLEISMFVNRIFFSFLSETV